MGGQPSITFVTDENIDISVKKIMSALKRKFQGAHYNLDIESITWNAAAVLFRKPAEKRTQGLLYVIAYRDCVRDLSKMRNTYVMDILSDRSSILSADDVMNTVCDKITMNSLTDEERQMIYYYIVDDLTKTDMSELMNVSLVTIHNKWRTIISKLRNENL